MMTMFEGPTIDMDSLELLYFYIPDYLVFKNQGFCLHPKYDIRCTKKDNIDDNDYTLEITVNEKTNFVDLFEEYNINLKIICGQNGVGKTSLLRILSNGEISKNKCFYLFKDKNNNFIASKQAKITFKDEEHEINIDLCNKTHCFDNSPANTCVTVDNIGIKSFAFEKNITSHYFANKDLYKGIFNNSEPITNFTVSIWNKDNELDEIETVLRIYLPDKFDYTIRNIITKNFLFFSYFIKLKQYLFNAKGEYHILKILLTQSRDEDNLLDSKKFENNFLEYFNRKGGPLFNQINDVQDSICNKEFSLNEIDNVQSNLIKLSNLLNKLFNVIFPESDYIDFSDLFYLEGYTTIYGRKRHINNFELSMGEYFRMKYTYEIFVSIQQLDGYFWYLDEPERSLHPEACRTFLYNYMLALKSTRDYMFNLAQQRDDVTNPEQYLHKKYTLLICTHSPFLLSDVTNDYVIYLQKNEETGLSFEEKSKKDVFAGNIGEMFITNFFMHNTIGEFSKNYISSILKKLNSEQTITKSEKEKFRKIISHIGDDILRSLLNDCLTTPTLSDEY